MDLDKNIDKIREDFPGLKSKTWLDSAGVGPPLKPVIEAVKSYFDLVLTGSFDKIPKETNAKAEAAKLLHADEYELCWICRVSQGLNMISSMMKFKRGENVVVTDLVYPSSVYVWLPFREQGVEIRRIKNQEGKIPISEFEKFIDDNTGVDLKVFC